MGHQPVPNYHQPNYQTGFHPGTGPGSVSRGSQWKTALAAGAVGAVGGVLAYEAGKAIIKSATEPANINGRNYYFNNDEHKYQQKADELVCSMPLEALIKQTQPASTTTTTTAAPDTASNSTETTTPSPDQLLSSMQFKDGSRPKTVTWTCKRNSEVCCGTECCPTPPQQVSPAQSGASGNGSGNKVSLKTILLIGVLVILIMMCCCCFIIYSCFRSAFETCCPMFNDSNPAPYNDEMKPSEVQPQAYAAYQSQPMQPNSPMPMQTYPGSPGYQQPQNGYPPAGGYVYPSQPYQYPSNYQ